MTAKAADTQKTDTPGKQPSFEKSIERLEKIVAEMESGDLDLDSMIGHFEEGQALIKRCQSRLNDVARRVEQLVKAEDGSIATAPFDEKNA